MKIESGKFYRTRDGRRVGPVEWFAASGHEDGGFWSAGKLNWFKDGLWSHNLGPMGSDLVAEWTDGPVRTATRKEIVPGTYGGVEITEGGEAGRVGVRISNLHGPGGPEIHFNAAELRAAAATLTEIADALDAP